MPNDLAEQARSIVRAVPRILKNLRIGPLLEAARPGLTVSQLLTLLVLEEESGSAIPMSALADDLGVSLPTATGLVDRLVRDGLVARTPSDTDRRVVLVGLTPAGAGTIGKFLDLLQRLSAGVMAEMGFEEREALVRAFERVDTLSLQLQREQRRLASAGGASAVVTDREVPS